MNRRDVLKMGGAAMVLPAAEMTEGGLAGARGQFGTAVRSGICLNNARWHPLSEGAAASIGEYIAYKKRGIWNPPDMVSETQTQVKAAFARLIGATAAEVGYCNSTMAGENIVVNGLMDRLRAGGNIVTDGLHFEGSLYMYEALAKQGIEVRIVKPKDWRIAMSDLARMVDRKTVLVAVSAVSYVNGFSHDLKAVADLAHAHGAYLYADLVQAAGAVPLDMKALGVDFAASASYKWLMSDMGIGFLYVREGLLDVPLKRTVWGYKELADNAYHEFPGDAPGDEVFSWTQRKDVAGFSELGTYSNTTVMALKYSLGYLEGTGVAAIRRHGDALKAQVKAGLSGKAGFECITPDGSVGPIVTFRVADAAGAQKKLNAAKVDVSWTSDRMRISPSVYNDASDVTALLSALG
jgi:selenocysteine lyase/cysteine desulfurase